jgi:hypothetical protein
LKNQKVKRLKNGHSIDRKMGATMSKRGRPRSTWIQLRDRGARPSVWKKRKLLDEPPAPVVETELLATGPDQVQVLLYVAAVKRELDTFSARRVDGESLTREHGSGYDWQDVGPGYQAHGATFHWTEGSLLRGCRDYANEIIADHATAGSYRRELCERFLADVSNGCDRNRFYDVEAAKNVERMLAIFADPEKRIPWIRVLAMIEFQCLKDRDGEFVLPAEALLDFHEDDLETQDAAILALKAAA